MLFDDDGDDGAVVDVLDVVDGPGKDSPPPSSSTRWDEEDSVVVVMNLLC